MAHQQQIATFSEETSADLVIARNKGAENERLAECVSILVKHLHAAVREIEPTQDEWMAAISFLTETGHMCDEWRQEFILLSDVTGISMLVDAIANRKPSGATESTVLGPFFRDGVPLLDHGADICLDGKGEPMLVEARVLDANGAPIPGARVDVWQANEDGFYDVQKQGILPDCNLRGAFETGPEGGFWFKGAKPKFYPIPDDGPVGKLLAALGRGPYRPSHLHFLIAADGYETLVTHLFDRDDPYIGEDAVFGVKQSLVVDYETVSDPAEIEAHGFSQPFARLDYDFVLTQRAD